MKIITKNDFVGGTKRLSDTFLCRCEKLSGIMGTKASRVLNNFHFIIIIYHVFQSLEYVSVVELS